MGLSPRSPPVDRLISFRPYDGLLLREAMESLRAMPAYGAALWLTILQGCTIYMYTCSRDGVLEECTIGGLEAVFFNWLCLASASHDLASVLPRSGIWYTFLWNFSVVFFIDKCHWPQSKNINYYVCIVHDIKTTQTTSISPCLASASSSLPLLWQNCLEPIPDKNSFLYIPLTKDGSGNVKENKNKMARSPRRKHIVTYEKFKQSLWKV